MGSATTLRVFVGSQQGRRDRNSPGATSGGSPRDFLMPPQRSAKDHLTRTSVNSRLRSALRVSMKGIASDFSGTLQQVWLRVWQLHPSRFDTAEGPHRFLHRLHADPLTALQNLIERHTAERDGQASLTSANSLIASPRDTPRHFYQ